LTCCPRRAIKALHCCLELRRKSYNSDHPAIRNVLYSLSTAYNVISEHTTALECLQEALAIQLINDSLADCGLFELWAAVGKTQLSLGQNEDAKSSLVEASKVLWVQRGESDAHSLIEKMEYLTCCMGNFLADERDLNQAIAFFSALINLSTAQIHNENEPHSAPAA